MSATAATRSMTDLLNAVMNEAQKTAADNAEPGTSSGISGTPEGEATYTEGERSAENDAFIRKELGDNGAEGAPSPEAHTGEYNQSHRAAKIAPTGEDPESENNRKGLPVEAEPGTSASGLSLGEKVGNWTKKATELLVDYSVDAKLGDQDSNKAAADVASADTDKSDKAAGASDQQYDNPYLALTDGDEESAKQAYEVVQAQLIDAQLAGEKLAMDVVNHLSQIEKMAQENERAGNQPKKLSGALLKKLSMDPAMAGPPPEAAPPEAAAMGGGEEPMPPEMAGGDPSADPQMMEQAIMELAQEMGVPPEQLIQELEAAMAGGGGEGGMPPEPAPEMAGPPAESGPPAEPSGPPSGGGESSGGDEGGGDSEPPKEGHFSSRLKRAAAVSDIKKNAMSVLRERAKQSQR